MATTVSEVSPVEMEKQASSHHEDLEKEDAKAAAADYSGAVAKTDPVEIKLVRKLDLFIMVSDSINSLVFESCRSSHVKYSPLSGLCTGSTSLIEMLSL